MACVHLSPRSFSLRLLPLLFLIILPSSLPFDVIALSFGCLRNITGFADSISMQHAITSQCPLTLAAPDGGAEHIIVLHCCLSTCI